MRRSDATEATRVAPTLVKAAPSAPVTARWAWMRRIDVPAFALLLGGLALRFWLLVRGWPSLDSDEAVIGLMGRHILYGGERPIFYYGQHYMGALEAYLAALSFWLFGPSQASLRLVTFIMAPPFLLCVYLLGRAAYGRAVGLLTLAALAFGPAFGLMREAPAIGGYPETLVFGALLALIAYHRLRSPTAATPHARWAAAAQYAAFGLIAGLGVWSDELILLFILTPLLALALGRSRELLSRWALAGLTVGFLIGAAPFIQYNLLHHGQTFIELSLQEQAGHLGVSRLLSQVGATLSIGIPATFGSPQVCVAPRAVYAGYMSYPASAVREAPLSACQALNLANMLLALAILCMYVAALWPLLRVGWRATRVRLSRSSVMASREAGIGDTDRERAARLWLRCMLALAALGTIAEYALSRRSVGPDQFVAARYLLPLYITLPVVIGVLWEPLAAGWRKRRSLRPGHVWLRGGLAGAALVLLLACFLASGVQAVITASDASRFALPATPDQHVIARLHDLGITAFYGDYWTCYNLVFESGERLHCSSYPNYERYAAYAVYLSHVQHPAYLMLAGTVGGARFERSEAPALYRAGYVRTQVDGIIIYYLPATA